MKKIWSYLTVLLAGVVAGLIIMYKLAGEKVSVTVRKVKNKRISGQVDTTIPIKVVKGKDRRKKKRHESK